MNHTSSKKIKIQTQDIMVTEIIQTPKDKYYVTLLLWGTGIRLIQRNRKESGAGVMGSDCLMGTEFQLEKMKLLWMVVVMVAQQNECT